MKLYFATDVHGSEICWKKFISAAKFYEADTLILGGDMTGKAIIPIIAQGGDRYKVTLLEQPNGTVVVGLGIATHRGPTLGGLRQHWRTQEQQHKSRDPRNRHCRLRLGKNGDLESQLVADSVGGVGATGVESCADEGGNRGGLRRVSLIRPLAAARGERLGTATA